MKTKLKELPKKIALRLLIDNLHDNNDYILLLSRWNSNEREKRAGLLSSENYRMYKARIEHALSEYIDELSERDLRKVLTAVDLADELPTQSLNSTHSTSVTGDNNIVIQGVNDSKVTIFKDSKNVMIGSTIQAGRDVHIGDKIGHSTDKSNKNTAQNKQVILFVAANPSKNAKINLRVEHSTISEELEENIHFSFLSKMATSLKELNMAVVEKKPSILHFAGHGIPIDPAKQELLRLGFKINDDTGLVFHTSDKNDFDVLNTEKSEQTFRDLKAIVPNLKMVILNACYSQKQAMAISKNGIYTIGTNNKIKDDAAIAFAQGFYWRYAKTKDIKKATQFGILQANNELDSDTDANSLIHLFYNGQEVQL